MPDLPQLRPEDMRQAMAAYVRAVHQSYLTVADLQSPAGRAQMPLLHGPFTVIAAGVQNLHVIASTDPLPAPVGPEVSLENSIGQMRWTVRFYDPVVLPPLGLINEAAGNAGEEVRRAVGITTHLYHLIVQPGSQLSEHHAGHAGTGLANAHVAEIRDFDAIRARVPGREALVDEMAGAARAGLRRAQALLAAEIAPDSPAVAAAGGEPEALRRAVLAALRGEDG